jgi:hypothetical protein
VKVVEHGFEDTPSGLKNMLERAAGWGEALTLMKFHVERSLSNLQSVGSLRESKG